MKTKMLLFLMLCCKISIAQFSNNVWCFGDSARIDFVNGIAIAGSSIADGRGTSTTIADSVDNLLFYTCHDPKAVTTPGYFKRGMVYSSIDSTMENGDSIISTGWYNEHIIIPNPSGNNKFYLFNKGEGVDDGFYYNEIDLSFNNGLGKMITKNNQLLNFRMFDGIAATKHGNGRDWWVICKPLFVLPNYILSDTFYVYLITPDSVHAPTKQRIGTGRGWSLGNMTFNTNGSKLCYNNLQDIIEVYDFDRCSGTLSNANIIYNSSPGVKGFWGSSFSPNDSLLYASSYNVNPSPLYQFNIYTHAMSIVAQIASSTPGIGRSPGALRLAPDGKIYMTTAAGDTMGGVAYPYDDTTYYAENMYLGVIENPNVQGVGCNFNPYGFYLGGKRSYWGLPNNPNYELGVLIGSPCDTLTNVSQPLSTKQALLNVYYHPSRQTLFVNAQNIKGKNCLLQIFDMNGRCVFTFHNKAVNGYFTHDVPLQTTANGIYMLKLTTEKETLTTKFVKQ